MLEVPKWGAQATRFSIIWEIYRRWVSITCNCTLAKIKQTTILAIHILTRLIESIAYHLQFTHIKTCAINKPLMPTNLTILKKRWKKKHLKTYKILLRSKSVLEIQCHKYSLLSIVVLYE